MGTLRRAGTLASAAALIVAPLLAVPASTPAVAAPEAQADSTPKLYTTSTTVDCRGRTDVPTLFPGALTITTTMLLPTSVAPGQQLTFSGNQDIPEGHALIEFDFGTTFSDIFAHDPNSPYRTAHPVLKELDVLVADGIGDPSVNPVAGVIDLGEVAFHPDALDPTWEYSTTATVAMPSITVPSDAATSIDLHLAGTGLKLNMDSYAPIGCKVVTSENGNEQVSPVTIPVVGDGQNSHEDVPDKVLSATLSYRCNVNHPPAAVLDIPVTLNMTVPERIAPNSTKRIPSSLTLHMPAMAGEVLTGAGYGNFALGYSDNLDVNVTTNGSTTPFRYPRVTGAATVPPAAFDVNTLQSSVLINVPANSTGTVDLSAPTATQQAHPRADVGGTIAFTVNLQIYANEAAYQAGYQPATYGILICWPSEGTDLTIGQIEIDPTLTPTNDVAVEEETLPVVTPAQVTVGETEVNASSSIGSSSTAGTAGTASAAAPAAGSAAQQVTATGVGPDGEPVPVAFGTDASATLPPESDDAIDPTLAWAIGALLAGTCGVLLHHRRATRSLKQ